MVLTRSIHNGIRTTLIDMHFKVIFNNIDYSTFSAKNHKIWLKQLETSHCVNYSMWNLKHSAKYVYRTGTLASSTARAGTSCEMERRRTRNLSSTLLTSFRFPTTTSRKVDPTVTATGRKKWITSSSSRISSRRNARREISWVFTTGSSVMKDSAKNMIDLGRSEEICREMDKLANEDHTHHITPDEIRVYRNNWWICSNFVGSDTMPVRHRADFKEALSTLRPQGPGGSGLLPKVAKQFLHSGGTGKNPGGILHLSITATMDPALIDRGSLIDGDWANYSENDSQH